MRTRALLAALFVAHAVLVRAFDGLANQSEVLAPYFLFYLLFADFRSRRPRPSGWGIADLRFCYLRNLLAVRGLQLQLALFYLFNGFTKAMHAEWLEGRAVADVAFMDWAMTSDLRWIGDHPIVYVPVTYSVLAYELLFPLWMCFSRTRTWAVAYGILAPHDDRSPHEPADRAVIDDHRGVGLVSLSDLQAGVGRSIGRGVRIPDRDRPDAPKGPCPRRSEAFGTRVAPFRISPRGRLEE